MAGELGGQVRNVLAVVQNEKQPLPLEVIDDALDNVALGFFPDAQHRCDFLGKLVLTRKQFEGNKPDAIWILTDEPRGDLDRQTRLTDPTDSAERHKAGSK